MTDTETQEITSADVATVPKGVIDVPGDVSELSKDELTRWLSGVDLPDNGESDEGDYEAALRILGADTLEKALAPDDVRKSESLIDTSFVVTSVRWNQSTKLDRGPRRYAFLSCVDLDGVKFYTSIGGTYPVLALARMERDGDFPVKVKLTGTTTGSGNTMTRLELDPDF